MIRMVAGVLVLLSLALLTACASAGERRDVAAPAVDPGADWALAGWRIIGCCCSAPCPCRIDKKPSFCHGCDHTDVVHVERGHMGSVKMDGVQWSVVGNGFGEDTAGSWAHVYVDERATDEQVKALGDWLGAGVTGLGPKATFLVGKFLGLREVPMTTKVSADRHEYSVSIPGILDFQTRAIFNPGHSEPVVSTGIMDAFGDRFVHSDAPVHRYADATLGHSWDLAGRQSNQAEFSIDSTRAARGGIGWGCWSAHAALGDSAPYGEQYTAPHGVKP